MGITQFMMKEAIKELDNRSKEFYEFILPPIDMYEDGSILVLKIDLPGFSKNDIKIRITKNILSIIAKRQEEITGLVHFLHRPNKIDKKVYLPFSIEDQTDIVGSATYTDGVVTLRIPIPKTADIPIT